MDRIYPECGSKMEELSATLWVCPACKLLQFRDENGNIQTRYPHPIRVTGEEPER
jgi:transposase